MTMEKKCEPGSQKGTSASTDNKPELLSISLEEVYRCIKRKEGDWAYVDPELGVKIKSLLESLKAKELSLTMTAFIQYPVCVSRIDHFKDDGTKQCLAIESADTPLKATAISAETALKNAKKALRKNPFTGESRLWQPAPEQ